MTTVLGTSGADFSSPLALVGTLELPNWIRGVYRWGLLDLVEKAVSS